MHVPGEKHPRWAPIEQFQLPAYSCLLAVRRGWATRVTPSNPNSESNSNSNEDPDPTSPTGFAANLPKTCVEIRPAELPLASAITQRWGPGLIQNHRALLLFGFLFESNVFSSILNFHRLDIFLGPGMCRSRKRGRVHCYLQIKAVAFWHPKAL